MASELMPGVPDGELTAVAVGACYAMTGGYVPLYVDRIPARVVLRLREPSSEQQVEYEPFRRLPWRPPSAPYVSDWLQRTWGTVASYDVIVEDLDGNPLHAVGEQDARLPEGGFRGPPANKLRLVLDRFGRIWVEMVVGREDMVPPGFVAILQVPPWQTMVQRAALQRLWGQEHAYEVAERNRLVRNITQNPWGWQKYPG